MRVLVAGGGIGGLTAALSLHAAGIEVEVLEWAPAAAALGTGIGLLAHAMGELDALGVGAAVEAAGVVTTELACFDRFGDRIACEPRGRAAGHRRPQVAIGRGELQTLLLEALRDRLGPAAVRFAVAVEGFEQTPDIVRVRLRDRVDNASWTRAADVLVGADGSDSRVRARLHPGDGPERWGAGRVTLLGDAAHPMHQIGSDGASRAIVDARVLAHELARCGRDAAQGLAAYERRRRRATSALALAGRREESARILSLVERRAPDGSAALDAVPEREQSAVLVVPAG